MAAAREQAQTPPKDPVNIVGGGGSVVIYELNGQIVDIEVNTALLEADSVVIEEAVTEALNKVGGLTRSLDTLRLEHAELGRILNDYRGTP